MQQGQAVGVVRRAGKACLIAKDSRLPADWARPPWLAHFALQAGLTCPADGVAFFRSKRCVLIRYIARFMGSGATSTFTPSASNALT